MKTYDRKYFEDNFDKPHIPNIPANIKTNSVKKMILKVDDISVDSFLSQIRVNDDLLKRASSLDSSFTTGIDWDQPLPIVKLRKDNGSYSLIDAFGRFEMFELNGQKYWIMVVVECDELNEIRLRGWANRVTYFDRNSLKDNIETISTMVRKRMIKPTRRNFNRELNIIEPHKDPKEKTEIISTLVDEFKVTPTPKSKRFVPYTAATIMKNWVNKHFADAKKLGFKLGSEGRPAYSKKSNCYFGILQYKYEYRKVLQAISTKVRKNVPLKVLGLSEGKGMTQKKLKSNRIGIKRNLSTIFNNFDKLVEMYHGEKSKIKWDEVIHVFGFVPESVNEDPKEPLEYKEIV
tara:strand:+ start:48 stop:1088 length:1041 start_codon:yes stop_codon:yes gene_type:complete